MYPANIWNVISEMPASEVSLLAALRHFGALAFTHKTCAGLTWKVFYSIFYYAECRVSSGSSAWHNERIPDIHTHTHIYIHIYIYNIYTHTYIYYKKIRVMCRKCECREDIHYKTQTGTSCEKCNSKAFRLGIEPASSGLLDRVL